MCSGLYIHVPICASRCIYCDFYSTTRSGVEEAYVDAVLREAATPSRRRDTCLTGEIRTLYIGGGTPSRLGAKALRRLLDGLSATFDLTHVEEATLEVNPEDVDEAFVSELFDGGCHINRVSMGVQSFIDEELRMLRRRHDAARPAEAVSLLRRHGVTNISIDLMYGLPAQTPASWERNVEAALALGVPHLSAYCLSVEEGTPLARMLADGTTLRLPGDEECNAMAARLRARLKSAGYRQYEISNYALPGFHSRHNSTYWDGTPYLGLGPGAHSYDGAATRYSNAADLDSYIYNKEGEGEGSVLGIAEHLSPADIRNERVMLGLRTRRGIDERLATGFEEVVAGFIGRGLLTREDGRLRLTEAGLDLGDEVTRGLFLSE